MCLGHHMGGVMCAWVITWVGSCKPGSSHGWGHVSLGHCMGGVITQWGHPFDNGVTLSWTAFKCSKRICLRNQEKGDFRKGVLQNVRLSWLWRSDCQKYCCGQ